MGLAGSRAVLVTAVGIALPLMEVRRFLTTFVSASGSEGADDSDEVETSDEDLLSLEDDELEDDEDDFPALVGLALAILLVAAGFATSSLSDEEDEDEELELELDAAAFFLPFFTAAACLGLAVFMSSLPPSLDEEDEDDEDELEPDFARSAGAAALVTIFAAFTEGRASVAVFALDCDTSSLSSSPDSVSASEPEPESELEDFIAAPFFVCTVV